MFQISCDKLHFKAKKSNLVAEINFEGKGKWSSGGCPKPKTVGYTKRRPNLLCLGQKQNKTKQNNQNKTKQNKTNQAQFPFVGKVKDGLLPVERVATALCHGLLFCDISYTKLSWYIKSVFMVSKFCDIYTKLS